MQTKSGPFEIVVCPGCGTPCGPRAKFCSECGLRLHAAEASASARAQPPGPALATPAPPLGPPQPMRRPARTAHLLTRAERRQLTVMFCDLVGSTELSTRLDPEELGELLGRYRALVEGEVEKLGGTVARVFGDGVLVYFGYPFAREDDAVRAVRAALNIVRGIAGIGHDVSAPPSAKPAGQLTGKLRVHVGIHTGMVLIDRSPGGAAGEIIGETPNLAAKVEAVAPPDTVLVSSATQALTADMFDYTAWGPLDLKGQSPPTELFRLVGERDWRREDSITRERSKALFGRSQETTRLARLWREAMIGVHGGGGGRVATIVGEPGIGKTRLTQWTAAHAEAAGGVVLKLYCAEEAVDTAFWPVSETIARLCRIEGQRAATQSVRLRRAAARAGLPPELFVPAIADMLGLTADVPADVASPPNAAPLTAEGRRNRLVELLLRWVANLSNQAPLLLIVENVHWADPSSRLLLDELAKRASGLRLLMLVTARPVAEALVPAGPAVERMTLDRLPARDLEAMLTALWRDAILPDEMQRLLLDKCDGVPLFLEQLVKTVAERAHRGGPSGDADVPTSLRDMLAARLDRLGSAKLIALAASVIGRQFPARLLAALLPRRAHEIDGALAVLAKADIIRPVVAAGEPTFKFRHALLRDAAYDSLLRTERSKFHRMLARAYRRHYGPMVEAQPELVARHASAAGEHLDALAHWWKAGLRARARSANREATAHFRAGIADAERLADPDESKAQVVRFTMATSRAAIAAEGFASPEVERLNNRALALVEAGGADHLLPAALSAVFAFYQVRGPLRRAQESAEWLLRLAGDAGPVEMGRNKRRAGWCTFCRGEIAAGKAMLTEALGHMQAHDQVVVSGLAEGDAEVVGLANVGWVESFAGELESAAARAERALELGRRRYAEMHRHAHDVGNIPGDLAYALCMSAAVAKQMQDAARTATFAGEARDLALSHDLPYWRAWSTVLLGWGVGHTDGDRGIALMTEGIDAYKATGARLFVPYNLALLAESCMALGRVEEGLGHVAEALAVSSEIQCAFVDSELLRIRGRLMWLNGDKAAALETLTHAIELADRHGAKTIQRWAARDRTYISEGGAPPFGLVIPPHARVQRAADRS